MDTIRNKESETEKWHTNKRIAVPGHRPSYSAGLNQKETNEAAQEAYNQLIIYLILPRLLMRNYQYQIIENNENKFRKKHSYIFDKLF